MTFFSRKSGVSSIESFANFDIEFSGYEKTGDTERVHVRVLDSPVGGHGPDTFETVEFPTGLRERTRKLENRDLSLEEITQLGSDLALILLPDAVRDLYVESLATLEPTQGLRIRLRMGTWALATLPWEYTYVRPRNAPDKEQVSLGFLSLNRRLSLVRYEVVQGAPPSLDPVNETHLRVVALTAQPQGSAELALENETESLKKAVGKINDVRLDTLPHATWDEFQSRLDEPVHILHFAGHGQFDVEMGEDYGTFEGRGSLLFETATGEVDARPATDVALVLNNTGVRLVALSACEGGKVDGVRAWSGIAPALARSGVPAVVAMQFRVRDDEAVAFSRRFYENLTAGGSIDTATTAGRLAMFDSKNKYGRDWGAPVLYFNAKGGKLFPKPVDVGSKPDITRRFVANVVLGLTVFMLGATYFLLHLEPLFSGTHEAGGALVAVLLSLFLLALDKFLGTVIVDSLLAWFRKKGATMWLATACGLLFTLNFFTTSIFLIPDQDSPTFHVKVTQPDHSFEKSWDVTTETMGEIFHFNKLLFSTVTIGLEPAACYDKIERSMYPFTWNHLHVPRDFSHQFTLLRLIPSPRIWNRLEGGHDIVLRITVNGVKPPALEVKSPKRSVLIFGDTPEKMDCKIKESRDQLEAGLRRYLKSRSTSEDSHDKWVNNWSNNEDKKELILKTDDQLLIELSENEKVIFSQSVSVATCKDKDGLCDVFMEKI